MICNVATETIDSANVKISTVKPFLNNTYELPSSPVQNLRYIANAVHLGTRIAGEQKIDIIHTNSFTPVIAGSIISKIKGIPMVASIYDIVSNIGKKNWKNWVKYNKLPWYYPTVARLYEKVSLSMPFEMIHTISKTSKEDILQQGKKKAIRVVYPSIDDRHYKGVDTKFENYILYIGRLVFYKNVDILIRAYDSVKKEVPGARLIVVGEGPMSERWKILASSIGVSDNIVFTTHLSHQEKIDLLSKCSALALPSIFEGFGLVVLEAFAMGKPDFSCKYSASR